MKSRKSSTFDRISIPATAEGSGEANAEIDLPMRTWRAGETWYRIHRAEYEGKWFGPSPGDPPANRFDDPLGEYRVCYLGATLEASFAETLLRNPPHRLLALSDLEARSLTKFRLERQVRVVRMHSDGLAKLGLTAEAIHGDYEDCGLLAHTLWGNSVAPDGLEYRSRHDDEQLCIALFDRAADSIVAEETEGLTGDTQRLVELMRRYGVGIR
jgi:hypothetical protein